jgi:hypothetical protein
VSAPDILTAAYWLQDRHGLYVFAVDHPGRPVCGGSHRECDGQRGKHPRGKWPRLATLSHVIIRAQLAHGPWNLGVACKFSGLLGVDEDRRGAFAEFAASIGETIPSTFRVRTSKGLHYYFRQAEGAPLGNGRGRMAGHGIDVRGGGTGDGGYLVGPGSTHASGVLYEPVDPTTPILSVPAWLAEVLAERPAETVRCVASSPVPLRPGSHAERVLCGLVGKVLNARPPAPGVSGERNNVLFWAAARGFEHSARGLLAEADVRATLLKAAIQAGLNETASLATINSAYRNVAGGAV